MEKLNDFILKVMRPFVKWWGALHMPFTHKKVTGLHYYKYRDMIKEGTVFLTSAEGEFSNLINPSEYKHGAVYLGKVGNIPMVLESVGRGVVLTDLVSFMTTKDKIVAFEPGFEYNKETFKAGSAHLLGSEYDYLFSSGNKKYYCFEAVVQMFMMAGAGKEWIVENKLGRSYFTSTTFTEDSSFHKLFEVK